MMPPKETDHFSRAARRERRAPAWANFQSVSGRRPGSMLLRGLGLGLALGLGLTAALSTSGVFDSSARADQLSVEERESETGYTAVEELSYEAIVEATDGYMAGLRLRVALHNNANTARDAVLSLALPRGAELDGLRIARDDAWTDGKEAIIHHDPDRRDPGTIYVRQLEARRAGELASVEVVAFGLPSGKTTQIELALRVQPTLHGDRWELELPERGPAAVALAADRRVLVKQLKKGEAFSVDERDNAGAPFVITSARDTVTVAWPAHLVDTDEFEGRLEIMPGPAGFDDGEVDVYVRLGQTVAPRPDHIVLAVDRSRSTKARLQRETIRLSDALLDAMPKATTFDAIGFDRRVERLLITTADRAPTVRDAAARRSLQATLEANVRGQGTDLAAALADAAGRARQSGAKRPMILVVTDGMLPLSLDADAVYETVREAWGRRRLPEILFVVDDPMLMKLGLSPSHPVARVAARLGARISLETLSTLQPTRAIDLLAAPQVLGQLSFDLPENVTLHDPPPSGLVAGSYARLRGHYVGTPPTSIEMHGTLGGKATTRKLTAQSRVRRPAALAASTDGEVDVIAAEGFARPPWYESGQQRTARQSIQQAGRGGRDVKGYLDRKIFRNYLTTRVLPRARVCYNHALQRDAMQAGRVELTFEIGKGEVMLAGHGDTDLEQDDPKLVECLVEAAWALDIPAGKLDDKVYLLNYPLRLIPPETGEVAGEVEGISEEMMKLLLGHPNDLPSAE
jgi:Mg-chelatase subunit ChlD